MSDIQINEQEEFDDRDNADEDIFDKVIQKKIFWRPMDYSIQELYNKHKKGELDLSPTWQRNYVYDIIKASRLIESVLMDVPLPAVYLAEEADGTMSVIDGQQRLSTFFFYIDNKFPDKQTGWKEFKLSGLKLLDLKCEFSKLEKSQQSKIQNTPIHVVKILNESNEDVKFDIFERLNTGSMKLNEDEIRNSVYRGSYIELLDKLAENKKFDEIVRKPNFKTRMLYRGMVLRFIALSEKTYLNYKPSMKQFCNKELRNNRNLLEETAKEYKSRFEKCIDLCYTIFGINAFRRFKTGDSKNHDGNWSVNRINMALFDIQMCCFVQYTSNQIITHADEIREAMIDLMCNNTEFIQSIEIQTSGTKQMVFRFEKWFNVLKQILTDSPPAPRVFPYSVKKQLFDADPTCKICNNRIMAIEDAEVDHVTPYSQGGPTTIDNAQIAHRYCNRHKSDKTE